MKVNRAPQIFRSIH